MSEGYIRRINFIEKGNGPPVILIHGVGLDHTMFRHQIDFLSLSYKVIAYDMLGHGKSENPDGSYQLLHFVDQLNQLLMELKIERVNIVGFSMGAMVAQLFAIRFPEKVISLCIMSAVANRNEEQQQNIMKRVEQVKENGHLSTIDAALSRWFTQYFALVNTDLVNEVRSTLENNDSEAYLKAYSLFALSDQDLWHQLGSITSPTLIVTGEKDTGSTPDMAMQIGEKIHNSRVVIVPFVKHMLPMEGKKELEHHLLKFLNENNFN
ncbi:3-oxoadipate enol-lactonase [Lentibacillus kapialis]|uniref:3-oxoadipate enol-lactonase n=1 Tax=Lentibacillus kapialis TaxID=340214 RepID=A0A917PXG5_9BACI|nr:alpha/beta hydrolase [Lentibacillus kapialis]GGJ98530.1 3-oxoadipate enol-lactonase [Lentibacillus kapialis]